ncbi:MFS transporter [Streptomyces sp. NPDC058812]|uniref:MFS transporter n=1 Tax=unclassified Streptomyces TaxID=2593676 RepID=UPI0036BB8388
MASAALATPAARAPDGAQGRYLGVVTAGMTAALFSGVPLGSWLGGALGWRATSWTIAAVGAIAAAGLLATAPLVPGGAVAPLRERLAPLRNRAVLRLVAVTFLAASGGPMFYTCLGPFTSEVAGSSYVLLSFVLFLVGAAGLAGALLVGASRGCLGPAAKPARGPRGPRHRAGSGRRARLERHRRSVRSDCGRMLGLLRLGPYPAPGAGTPRRIHGNAMLPTSATTSKARPPSTPNRTARAPWSAPSAEDRESTSISSADSDVVT